MSRQPLMSMVACAILLLRSQPGIAQGTPASAARLTEELTALSQEWMAAVQHHDSAALERLMGSDFMLVHPSQDSVTRRAQWLAAANGIETRSFRYVHLKVVPYADSVAVVSAIFVIDAEANGRPWPPKTSVIDVWKKREGRWVVVTRYATRREELAPPRDISAPPPTNGAL